MDANWQTYFVLCALAFAYPYLVYPLILAQLEATSAAVSPDR